MRKFLFSIITVCLNDRAALDRTYQSVNRQSFGAFEWIVIDGKSEDGTVSFLNELKEPWVQWRSETDNGLYDAMNKGIELAEGGYLLFLNAGDELAAANVLERLADIINANIWPDLLYGDSFERTADDKLLYKKSNPHRRIWYGMFTHHQSIFYKRSTVGSLRYRLEYPICSDYAFTGEVLYRSANVIRLPFALSIFAQGGLSSRSFHPGERDYWRIKRDVLHHSLVSRIATSCAHHGMRIVRNCMPSIYRWLRFRVAKPGGTQS